MSTVRTLPRRSFNKHDCSVSNVEGRIEVQVDMKRRLGLVVNALGRRSSGFTDMVELTDHLNSRLGSKYSANDIRSAVKVLRGVGIVKLGELGLTKTGMAKYSTLKFVKVN